MKTLANKLTVAYWSHFMLELRANTCRQSEGDSTEDGGDQLSADSMAELWLPAGFGD